ncbi:hypothetical protein TanjilG_03457 [Lupinus angustifolius]|uniref:Major facilitator superfamily (MFS) profile domain-containing protein n=1 Tax=Lupinus angustifolius TaxID=3871 RepID=A0A394DEP9_LUPAN|nr:hypothetical protein TanjilG_03457 [Lupinus angustifolius]
MSIAILPMSQEFNWNNATVGLIQSYFFWVYLLTQCRKVKEVGDLMTGEPVTEALMNGNHNYNSPKVVLGFGVIWWSIATLLTPIAAKLGLPYLLIMRAFMGIGEGVAMPAMNNMLSKWIPVSGRSRSLALVYSGMYLGSVTGLAFSPLLIQKFGWSSMFYAFGSLGSVWFYLMAQKRGWIADKLIMQSIEFLGPAFFLTQLSHVRTPAIAVLCMACSQSGLYSNHQDIGPRYAGVLLGLSNTAGVLAGVFGTAATGYILQRGSWNDDVFKVSVGTLVWNIFSTGEKVLD